MPTQRKLLEFIFSSITNSKFQDMMHMRTKQNEQREIHHYLQCMQYVLIFTLLQTMVLIYRYYDKYFIWLDCQTLYKLYRLLCWKDMEPIGVRIDIAWLSLDLQHYQSCIGNYMYRKWENWWRILGGNDLHTKFMDDSSYWEC